MFSKLLTSPRQDSKEVFGTTDELPYWRNCSGGLQTSKTIQ